MVRIDIAVAIDRDKQHLQQLMKDRLDLRLKLEDVDAAILSLEKNISRHMEVLRMNESSNTRAFI